VNMLDLNSQEWLKLRYQLQENNSNAVINPQATAYTIDPRRVYIKWVNDPTTGNLYNRSCWYYTSSSTIPNIMDCGHLKQSLKYPLQGRGPSEILSDEQKMEVSRRRSSGESLREIARLMGVKNQNERGCERGRMDLSFFILFLPVPPYFFIKLIEYILRLR